VNEDRQVVLLGDGEKRLELVAGRTEAQELGRDLPESQDATCLDLRAQPREIRPVPSILEARTPKEHRHAVLAWEQQAGGGLRPTLPPP
jgi:hypothetical protein